MKLTSSRLRKVAADLRAAGRGTAQSETVARRSTATRCSASAVASVLALFSVVSLAAAETPSLPRLAYNQPGLVTDLGIGLWPCPLPMDYNGDGLMDLVVSYTDKPSAGVYFFENSGEVDPQNHLPIFKPGVRLGKSVANPQVSIVNGQSVITGQATAYPDFKHTAFEQPQKLPVAPEIVPGPGSIRAKQWKYVDFDGDGKTDLVAGIDYWGEYGWDNAWDDKGNWKQGPLHGYVYVLRNTGTEAEPTYAEPVRLNTSAGIPAEAYGMPSPCFADFRGTGKLDLICGEFVDGFTYFENTGTRTAPVYAPGKKLTSAGVPLKIDLCMFTVTAVDFNGDGFVDLIAGEEDGRIAFFENTGKVVDGMPQFLPLRHFQQFAKDVKFGALVSPVSVDWDGDGLEDIIAGNSAGYVGFIKNLGGNPVRWAAPVYLAADGKTIREQAGPNGSIQGPAEAKWGYSNLSVADWDGDGLPDVIASGIWGTVTWYRNVGTKTAPRLGAGQPIEVAWNGPAPHPAWNWWKPKGNELSVEWRCTPYAIDLNHDGLMDLVMVDHEGYLAFFERKRGADGKLVLLPGQRIFEGEGVSEFGSAGQPMNQESGLLRLNNKPAGGSGRRTYCFVDWDGDGVLDLMVNSKNVNFLRGLGKNARGHWVFKDMGPVHEQVLAGHSTTPTIVHWASPGRADLLIGAEDGQFYLLPNPSRKTGQ